jgi:RimJ/RimL family protein N-acetyltransferase
LATDTAGQPVTTLDGPIETDRLLLRPFVLEDLDELHAIQSLPEVHRYLYSHARSHDEVREKLEERLDKYSTLTSEGDAVLLAVVVKDSGAMIGDVLFHWLSAEHMQAEIGYVLHPDHHGRGYATEAARALLRMGFEQLRMHRIVGKLDGRNAASARVLEKLGMRREAHFRENEFVKGEWTDEIVYAILASEWRG